MPSFSTVSSSESSSSKTFLYKLIKIGKKKYASNATQSSTPSVIDANSGARDWATLLDDRADMVSANGTTSPVASGGRGHVLTVADLEYIDKTLQTFLRVTTI